MMRKMNKLVLCLSFLLLPFAVKAQTTQGRFGYLSYNAIFQAMPEYEVSRQKLADLKSKYDKEAQRSEEEFQRKFKEESQKLLVQAEKDLQADMLYLLNEAIRAVGVERGYAYIINTDGNTCPFINPAVADDVTNYVKEKLQLPISVEP